MWWATAAVPEQVHQLIFHVSGHRQLHKLDIDLRELEFVIYIRERTATKEDMTRQGF